MQRKNILQREPSRRDLKTRTAKELEMLCFVMAIPYSGTKNKRIDRIMAAWVLRTGLKDFNSPQEIKDAFKGRELKEMCKTARLWRGGNKYSKSASLLNWRNECRKKGQQRVAEAREYNRKMREERATISHSGFDPESSDSKATSLDTGLRRHDDQQRTIGAPEGEND